MRLSDRQEIILISLLQDQREFAGQSLHLHAGASRMEQGRHRLVVQRARQGLVRIDLAAWLGRAPTASERVLFHRDYLRLEELGLLHRVNIYGGRRTTHMRLTVAGERVAQQLLDEQDDEAALDAEPIDLEKLELLPIELPAEAGQADERAEE